MSRPRDPRRPGGGDDAFRWIANDDHNDRRDAVQRGNGLVAATKNLFTTLKKATVNKSVPAKKSTPVKKSVPVKKSASVTKSVPAKKSLPAKKSMPAKKTTTVISSAKKSLAKK